MTVAQQVLILAIYVLAAARITRVINFDQIFNPFRDAYARAFKGNYLAVYFVTCPWCVGFWVSLVTAIVPVQLMDWSNWTLLPVGLASSMLIGVAAPLSADEEVEIEKVDEHTGE